MTELPIELECFLLKYGFFERDRAPNYIPHTRVSKPKTKRKLPSKSQGWTPSFEGEQPPF